MTDPFHALRAPHTPADPDPGFARALRARLERALLDAPEDTMTTTEAPTTTAVRLHTLTPYLNVLDARAAVEFYAAAFGAVPRGEPIVMPDGRTGHAEVVLGDSVLMLADEFPEAGLIAPSVRGGPSQSLRLEVADPDAVVARALAAGAELERPVADSPYGRGGVVRDPAGHRWMVSREPAAPRPGDVVYASAWTGDAERSRRFLQAVLGAALPGELGFSGGHPRPTLMACYAVPDVDAAAGAVRRAGGQAGDPADQPYGRVADCVDDQGLPFALWTGPLGSGRAGGLAHLALRVPDARRAMAFYAAVLGWTFTPARVADGWTVRAGDAQPRPRTSVWGGHAEAAAVPTFRVPDLAAAVRAAREAGGTGGEPQQRPFGLAADCADDQGLTVQLVQD
ncbi:MAG TPA: VOC family protein [Pseudonocardia sp.]|nr:VOC family protein [Pseudonocardia sp.]